MTNYSNISAILFFNDDDLKIQFISQIQKFPTLQKYKEMYFNVDKESLKLLNKDDLKKIKIFEIIDLNIDDSFFQINEIEENNIEENNDNIQYDNPEISIITCLYNTPTDLFISSINSMVNQTFKNWECILYNDGSDQYLDENIKFINSLNDNRFKIFHKEHNGKSNTLNMAIKKSKGKYIAIWDSDDQFTPERLEYQFNVLETSSIECISNCLIDKNYHVWPSTEKSQIIAFDKIHYLGFHPCQMFNKKKVLSKVPFLFEQIYDSMEDSLFNHIMFFYGVKMYFDNNILGEYCLSNSNAAHYDNFKPYLKFCTENLRYKKFNNIDDAKITCVLLVNHHWEYELEKTILNIRLTSDNVNIIIAPIEPIDIDEKLINIFACEILDINNYVQSLNNAINKCTTKFLYIISNPIRFCVEHWDYKMLKFIQNNFSSKDIIQNLMFDMEKINDDCYLNERGRYEKRHIRYGERLIQLTDHLSEEINYHAKYNEYYNCWQIPLLNKELCFFCSKERLIELMDNCTFETDDLFNVYLSLKQYNDKLNIVLYDDITCSIENYRIKNNYQELLNYIKIVKTFFVETQIIYEHIIHDKYKEEGKKLWESIQPEYLDHLSLQKFYKEINCTQSWII